MQSRSGYRCSILSTSASSQGSTLQWTTTALDAQQARAPAVKAQPLDVQNELVSSDGWGHWHCKMPTPFASLSNGSATPFLMLAFDSHATA